MPRLLAFVNIFADPSTKRDVLNTLSTLPNVEELCDVTGDGIVSLVSTASVEEIRDFQNNAIRRIPGVKSTVTSIVMKARRDPSVDPPPTTNSR